MTDSDVTLGELYRQLEKVVATCDRIEARVQQHGEAIAALNATARSRGAWAGGFVGGILSALVVTIQAIFAPRT